MQFSGAEAAQAGYLLDKLTRYNCLTQTQKQLLRSHLLTELKMKKSAGTSLCNSNDMLVKPGELTRIESLNLRP